MSSLTIELFLVEYEHLLEVQSINYLWSFDDFGISCHLSIAFLFAMDHFVFGGHQCELVVVFSEFL